MKVKFKIDDEIVIIDDKKGVICNDVFTKEMIETILSMPNSYGPQDGFYPSLKDHFEYVELLEIIGEPKNRVY